MEEIPLWPKVTSSCVGKNWLTYIPSSLRFWFYLMHVSKLLCFFFSSHPSPPLSSCVACSSSDSSINSRLDTTKHVASQWLFGRMMHEEMMKNAHLACPIMWFWKVQRGTNNSLHWKDSGTHTLQRIMRLGVSRSPFTTVICLAFVMVSVMVPMCPFTRSLNVLRHVLTPPDILKTFELRKLLTFFYTSSFSGQSGWQLPHPKRL